MINPLLWRFQQIKKPSVSLNETQIDSLNQLKEKLDQGVYNFEEVSCLCGEKNSVLISNTDRYALPVNTHLCRVCGVMWTSPRMTEDSLTKFYEEDYRSIYVGYPQAPDDFFTEQVQHGKFIHEYVSSAIASTKGLTVFDVGCGAGGVLVPFQESSWYTFGCDLGGEYLQRGRNAGLVLEKGDASILSKFGSANLVILSHVLEHFSEPFKSLEQIAQLLADDGYIYVELPGIFEIHRSYGDILLFLQNAHLYHFTLATLTSLMNKAGFKLVQGDEYIHALFQRDKSVVSISTQDQYRKVLTYLYIAECKRIFKLIRLTTHRVRRIVIKGVRYIMGDNLVDKLKKSLG